MSVEGSALIDWNAFIEARASLGAGLIRILGYFREDGAESVAAIEAAARGQNAAAMVMPAHRLKGEALQLGAAPLAALAESIEVAARFCVETRDTPESAIADVIRLRPLFEQTLALLEQETNPLAQRRPVSCRARSWR